MLTNPPDFDNYAHTLQQTMAEAIAEAEALSARASADYEATADVRVVIQAKLNELDHLARQAATAEVNAHHRELQENIRTALVAAVTAKLLARGESAAAVAELLEVPEEVMPGKPQ